MTRWCLRASVLRSTPCFAAICEYTSFSPGSSDAIAASAASIELILVDLSRVEIWWLSRFWCSERALRHPGHYTVTHGSAGTDSVDDCHLLTKGHQSSARGSYTQSPEIAAYTPDLVQSQGSAVSNSIA